MWRADPPRRRVAAGVALVALASSLACGDDLADPGPPPAPDPAPGAEARPAPRPEPAAPEVDDPGRPEVLPGHRLDAPERYAHLFLRAALPVGPRYRNLGYEGNNIGMRGERAPSGLYRSGDETAADWRRFAAGVRTLVVLRDSLFSQPDHPVDQRARALMMPPSWVSVAVHEARAGRPLVLPTGAEPGDDAAWAAPPTATAMFGSFPPSESLFSHAKRPLAGASEADAARTDNARRAVLSLRADAAAMEAACADGPEAVAEAGAERIAASDRRYFGASLRREVILPIFVENPNEHELRDEGKGMTVWGRELDPAAVDLARRAVYRRRLRDGDLAVERYDLTRPQDRARALRVLAELVPRGSRGHDVWLWVNGGSDGHGHGENAFAHLAAFQEELAAAPVAVDRVRLLSKPSVRPRGDDARATLEAAVDRSRALGVPLSVQLRTAAFARLLAD